MSAWCAAGVALLGGRGQGSLTAEVADEERRAAVAGAATALGGIAVALVAAQRSSLTSDMAASGARGEKAAVAESILPAAAPRGRPRSWTLKHLKLLARAAEEHLLHFREQPPIFAEAGKAFSETRRSSAAGAGCSSILGIIPPGYRSSPSRTVPRASASTDRPPARLAHAMSYSSLARRSRSSRATCASASVRISSHETNSSDMVEICARWGGRCVSQRRRSREERREGGSGRT